MGGLIERENDWARQSVGKKKAKVSKIKEAISFIIPMIAEGRRELLISNY